MLDLSIFAVTENLVPKLSAFQRGAAHPSIFMPLDPLATQGQCSIFGREGANKDYVGLTSQRPFSS